MHIEITPGQNHDITQAEVLLEHAEAEAIVADTAYDSGKFIDAIEAKGMKAVIKSHPNRKSPRPLEEPVYGLRLSVESFCHTLKRFRRIASRYEKTARNYRGMIHLACAMIWVSVGAI